MGKVIDLGPAPPDDPLFKEGWTISFVPSFGRERDPPLLRTVRRRRTHLDRVARYEGPVPTISSFYGIAIQIFWRDHAPPHFHALYAERWSSSGPASIVKN